jgi:NADH-quinone oxidoreductase subunit L
VAIVAAFFSALYIARVIFLAFGGQARTDRHAHESPPVMTIPLGFLAAGAAFGGVLGLSAATGKLQTFLSPVLGEVPEATHGLSEAALAIISVVVALAGIGVGWFVYGSGRIDWAALRVRLSSLQRFLAGGWYIDDVYATVVAAPGLAGSAFLAYVVDAGVIDGVVNSVGRLFQWLAGVGRRVQTGFVRTYALVFLVGAVALLVYVGFRL